MYVLDRPVEVQQPGDRAGADAGKQDREERAHHEHVAVGEVDELDDPVDHRVAQGDEGVDRADRQRVRDLLDRDLRCRGRRLRIEAEDEGQDDEVDDDEAHGDGRDRPRWPVSNGRDGCGRCGGGHARTPLADPSHTLPDLQCHRKRLGGARMQ
jgi:hypothetical protein